MHRIIIENRTDKSFNNLLEVLIEVFNLEQVMRFKKKERKYTFRKPSVVVIVKENNNDTIIIFKNKNE